MKKYTRFIFLIHDHIGNFNNFVFSLLMWELYYSPIHYGSSNDITVTDIHSELAQEATLLGNLLYVEGWLINYSVCVSYLGMEAFKTQLTLYNAWISRYDGGIEGRCKVEVFFKKSTGPKGSVFFNWYYW